MSKTTSKKSVLKSWVTCSPEALERANQIPETPGWVELSGRDVYIFLRLTREAAKAIGERLVEASKSEDFDPMPDVGHPEESIEEVLEINKNGFYIHPQSTSLSLEISRIPDIKQLISECEDNDQASGIK